MAGLSSFESRRPSETADEISSRPGNAKSSWLSLEMRSQMTIGKKLFTCLGALIALTMGLGAYALVSLSSLGTTMAHLMDGNAKRQALAGSVKSSMSDLGAAERGIILRAFMKDRAGMEGYNKARGDAAAIVKKGLGDLALLAEDPQEKEMISESQSGLERVDAAHSQIWQTASEGKTAELVDFDKTNVSPMVEKVSRLAQKLFDVEASKMAQANTDARSSVSRSRWISFCAVGLCLLLGAVGLWVVRQTGASLRKIVTELSNGGEQVASASNQIAGTSQSLSQGSSQQAASLEEISAAMEEMTAMARQNTQNTDEATKMMNDTATQVGRSNE